LAIAVIGLGVVAVVAWFWPTLLAPFMYGAAPGLAITAALLISQWLLHERYKRQLVFMPGFTRVKGGSSLITASQSPRVHQQPSTIDAPRPLETNDSNFTPSI
jgi:hypothetical protein